MRLVAAVRVCYSSLPWITMCECSVTLSAAFHFGMTGPLLSLCCKDTCTYNFKYTRSIVSYMYFATGYLFADHVVVMSSTQWPSSATF